MTKQVQRRRGTATQHTSFTGAEGEISVNTTNKSTHVHDGVTAGGIEAARADLDNVDAADVLAAAGITASATELNRVDGVTSPLQAQINAKAPKSNATFTGSTTIPTADINGGTIDGTVIGGNTPAAITGTDGTFTGDVYIRDDLFVTGPTPVITLTDNDAADENTKIQNNNGNTFYTARNGAANGQHVFQQNAGGTITEAMRISASGNVGLGVTNPTEKLHVAGNAIVSGDVSIGDDLFLTGPSPVITLTDNDIADEYTRLTNSDGATILAGRNGASNGIILFRGEGGGVNEEYGRFNASGNFGIGTASPSANLHVLSSGDAIARVTSADGSGAFLDLGDASDPDGGRIVYDSGSNLTFSTASTEAMRVTAAGSVGIGTDNPQALLYVGGNNTILGGTAGNDINLLTLHADTANNDLLQFTSERLTTGTDWTTAAHRIQRKVDATLMGYMQFGHNASNLITFGENATEYMRIDGTGRVGIGTASPISKLHVNSGTGNTVARFSSTDSVAAIYLTDSNTTGTTGAIHGLMTTGDNIEVRGLNKVELATGTTTKLIVDLAGDVGIGETNPDMKLHIKDASNAYVKLEDSGGVLGGAASAAVRMYTGASEQGQMGFIGTGSGIMRLNNLQGDVYIDADSNNADASSFIRFAVDNSEAMRIDASGNMLVGKTSSSGTNVGVELRGSGALTSVSSSAPAAIFNRGGTNGSLVNFKKSNVEVGSISVTASATAFNMSSDYRLKENVTPIQGAADTVMAMQPCTYTAIVDGVWYDGFLAHELAEVHPRAVTGTKDAMMDEEYEVTPAVYEDVVTPAVDAVAATYDDEGLELTPAVEAAPETTENTLVTEAVMGTRSVPDMQSVDYSKITPILTAALQEALTEIAALKVRVAALESA